MLRMAKLAAMLTSSSSLNIAYTSIICQRYMIVVRLGILPTKWRMSPPILSQVAPGSSISKMYIPHVLSTLE